jgi:hypothetical protein
LNASTSGKKSVLLGSSPGIICFTKGMETDLFLAVFGVFQNQKRLIKENFFRFGLADAMLLRVFAGVAFVPVKAGNLRPLLVIYAKSVRGNIPAHLLKAIREEIEND